MGRLLYRTFSALHYDRLVYKLSGKSLRILNYHGVCEDEIIHKSWIPSYFVAQSDFDSQLAYLRRYMNLLLLSEAVERLKNGTLPPRSVAITFDDGYANNLRIAYPILRKHNAPATIFLITRYVESGDFFPFIRPRLLLRSLMGQDLSKAIEEFWLKYKRDPLDVAMEQVDGWWAEVRVGLSQEQTEALRALRVEELAEFDPKLVEFGAHTHNHPILRNELPARREWEIATSIEKVQEWMGRPTRLFSYPNGDRGDFGEMDKQVLQKKGIHAAVTTIPGVNSRGCDLLALHRYPVSLHHDSSGFVAEITGLRPLLRSVFGATKR